jgi:hypothetical protein
MIFPPRIQVFDMLKSSERPIKKLCNRRRRGPLSHSVRIYRGPARKRADDEAGVGILSASALLWRFCGGGKAPGLGKIHHKELKASWCMTSMSERELNRVVNDKLFRDFLT